MRVEKFFCDVCGNEFPVNSDKKQYSAELKVIFNGAYCEFGDVCPLCVDKVKAGVRKLLPAAEWKDS